MPQMPVTLIKGDRIDPKTDYRDALPVNMYAVEREILGARGYMLCIPGLTQHATGIGEDRGAQYNERFLQHYRVSNGRLIRVDADGTVTVLGSIPGSSQLAMPYSFNTQAIIGDGRYFLYDPTTGFRQVTAPDLGSPVDGTWIDGYYFMTDGEFLFHTDLTDEANIDPLKFATSEFSPDPTLGIGKTEDNKAIAFNRYTIEYFVNQATENFAFTRVQTRALNIGIVATHAKVDVGGSWFITGSRKNESLGVYIVGVGQVQKVSSREIDKILAEYTEPELVDMRMEGRVFDNVREVIVHLPDHTLCFNIDIAQKFGKELAWSILRTGNQGLPHRAINGVFDANLGFWVYGDKYDSHIGYLDNSVFTQYGEAQEWELYTPLVNMETMSIDELEIETIPGTSPFDDATIAFSVTKDGLNYGSEVWDIYGEPGKYNQRYIQRALGYIDNWIGFKFRSVTKSRMAFGAMRITYG